MSDIDTYKEHCRMLNDLKLKLERRKMAKTQFNIQYSYADMQICKYANILEGYFCLI